MKKQERIIKNGRQALKKEIKKNISLGASFDVKKLKIQTVEPWKRGVLCIFAIILAVIGYWCWNDQGPIWLTILLICVAISVGFFGAIGKKQNIDKALKGLDSGVSNQLIESIIDGIF